MAFRVVSNRIPQITRNVKREVGKEVHETAVKIGITAQTKINTGPKTGHIRKVTKSGKVHQASAPGEAPATDTGNLAAGIIAEKDGPMRSITASNAEYSEVLELGSADGTLARRPYLGPSVDEHEAGFEARVQAAFERGIRQ